MAEGAIARGLEYLAVTDHSASHGFGDHVTPEALAARIEEVHALNARLDDFELLAGTEVNILTDGSLDYDDELLARLDWVIASVHTSFSMGEREMTDRMVAAIEHPLVDAIGHPTGRKIETRPPYALDIERVIEAAAAHRHDDRDQRRRPTAATSTSSTPAPRRRPASTSSSTPTPTRCATSACCHTGSPPRGGRG